MINNKINLNDRIETIKDRLADITLASYELEKEGNYDWLSMLDSEARKLKVKLQILKLIKAISMMFKTNEEVY